MANPRKKVSLAGRRPTVGEDATPERLRHAEREGASAVDGQGIRRVADAFDLLHRRGLLDRDDPARHDLMWEAGDRYRTHRHRAGLDGLAAFDFRRESVDGTGGRAATPTEAALRHRTILRAADAAVGPRLLPYLAGIVVDGRPAATLRPLVTDTSHARTAEALVIERLREALHRLCDHWDLRPPSRSRPIRAWQAEAREA